MNTQPAPDFYIAPRRPPRQGIGASIARALVVMACLDVAVLALWAGGERAPSDPPLAAAAPATPALPISVAGGGPLPAPPVPGPAPASNETIAASFSAAQTAALERPGGTADRVIVAETHPRAVEPRVFVPVTPVGGPEPLRAASAAEPVAAATVSLPPAPRPGSAAPEAPPATTAVALPTAAQPVPSAPMPAASRPARAIPAVRHEEAAGETHAPLTIVTPTRKPAPPRLPTEAKPVQAAAVTPVVPVAETRALPESFGCKPYFAPSSLSGERAPVRGIACPGPDGVWHIVSERRASE